MLPGSATGRHCELNADDRDTFFSIRDGVQCQCRQEKNWGGARATLGAFGGRVYYEVGACIIITAQYCCATAPILYVGVALRRGMRGAMLGSSETVLGLGKCAADIFTHKRT